MVINKIEKGIILDMKFLNYNKLEIILRFIEIIVMCIISE